MSAYDILDLLEEVSRSAHDSGRILSQGVMHPSDWESCPSMQCEDVRAALADRRTTE
jgi:hypothetical protein